MWMVINSFAFVSRLSLNRIVCFLSIAVVQARHLSTKKQELANAYVKVILYYPFVSHHSNILKVFVGSSNYCS